MQPPDLDTEIVAAPRSTVGDGASETVPAPLARADRLAVLGLVAVGIVARFATGSPLWLDEALSVNIASLPLGEIGDALRQDGHPPLYYWLLHGWMAVVGEGDVAVRSLSGLFAVAALPVLWALGRRRGGEAAGWTTVALMAVLPWAVRYGTEARMYALGFLLVALGWLLADDLLDSASGWRWAALAGVTGAGVLTHYWILFLGATAVVALAWRWWRVPDGRAGALRVGSALAAGALAFVPWVPSFLDQLASTGTPWASAARPTGALVELLIGIGGGGHPEAILLGASFVVLVVLALLLVPRGPVAELRFSTVPGVRGEVAVAAGTFGLGVGLGLVGDAVFSARYAAAFLPLLVVAAGVGLARLPAPWPRRVAGVGVAGLAAVGIVLNVVDDRTMGAELAAAIEAGAGPSDLVLFCPDQLGPATLRTLPDGRRAAGLPTLARPDRIDWEDYEARNRAADPGEAVSWALAEADGATIWLVVNTSYRTYEGYCEGVQARLQAARPPGELVVVSNDAFESATLVRFPPA